MNNEQYFRMAIPTIAPENKFNLTVEEACAYFNIGETTFRKLLDVEPNADYILYVGKKKELFHELWDGVTPLRLLGIAMTNITREETVQFSLFPDEKKEKARKIDKAKDALNAKFGSATIVRGSSIQTKIDVGKKYQAQIEQKKKEANHE